jgi:DNA-binding transcriptional MerR regulator
MDLMPIGEAASMLNMNTSALRYYEDRGLISPVRQAGRRLYSRHDLHRLAFIRLIHRLGLSLDTAAAVLNEPSEEWRETIRRQIKELDELISQAKGAQQFLSVAIQCPADHPVRDCPTFIGGLDRLLDGITLEELAAEHAGHKTT